MKQLVILSGKGGTGKTTVAAAFAHLAAEGPACRCQVPPIRAVLADADVDASNLELVLAPTRLQAHDFAGGAVAIVDAALCDGCGICVQVCRFDAITEPSSSHPAIVDPIACDGCAACVYQCPTQAIHMEQQLAGQWFRSDTSYGPLFHAALRPGQDNSGRLVTVVRQQARLLALDDSYELIIIDGPPGIGCPVISAATGTDLALLVTEPTVAGAHDLARTLETTEHFGIPALVCINQADLHPEGVTAIETFCRQRGVEVVDHIPFDTEVTRAMVEGMPVTRWQDNAVARELCRVWARVVSVLEEDKMQNPASTP